MDTRAQTGVLVRGPHRSAFDPSEFLREEIADMVTKKYWTVLPAKDILSHPDLRISTLV
jgi:hypothetical protein